MICICVEVCISVDLGGRRIIKKGKKGAIIFIGLYIIVRETVFGSLCEGCRVVLHMRRGFDWTKTRQP